METLLELVGKKFVDLELIPLILDKIIFKSIQDIVLKYISVVLSHRNEQKSRNIGIFHNFAAGVKIVYWNDSLLKSEKRTEVNNEADVD